ncbi:VF530 family protein [Paraglaciecola hydrolytica]|uniref:Transporter n=1 Tax=Paraglaciecola hydrolytica TaxID=1799789 RepID=A0A136A0I3_9ALTE|nr:VF530 family protein [Paraglaciecola hydrolytica]KXI28731.1 hypothetical protein AX660_16300 [Paraglaciecola hydrolytica]
MSTTQNNNPLHAVTLQKILEDLVEKLGWEKMAKAVKINCFSSDPSVKSSLTFLRKTPWAREQVEQLYLAKIAKQPNAPTTTKRPTTQEAPNNDSPATNEFVWPEPNKK